jgi:hypothetical protein
MLTVGASSGCGAGSTASAITPRRRTRTSSQRGYDLTDIIPRSVHLIVPRAQRGLHPPAGVTLHTTLYPLRDDEVTIREGLRLTTPERTLLDVAEMGTAPEQIERGIQTAVTRGWVQPAQLRRHAQERGARVARLVTVALDSGREPA